MWKSKGRENKSRKKRRQNRKAGKNNRIEPQIVALRERLRINYPSRVLCVEPNDNDVH